MVIRSGTARAKGAIGNIHWRLLDDRDGRRLVVECYSGAVPMFEDFAVALRAVGRDPAEYHRQDIQITAEGSTVDLG